MIFFIFCNILYCLKYKTIIYLGVAIEVGYRFSDSSKHSVSIINH